MNIPINPVIKPEKFLKNENLNNFIITHITNEEILEIITLLDNKAVGPQSIPLNLLKLVTDLILIPLCKIISNSFNSGVFPDALKICKVIPIYIKETLLINLITTDQSHYFQFLTKLLRKQCIKDYTGF